MKELIKAIDSLVSDEIKAAADTHPPKFSSLHEGYAVVLEERDEAKDEIDIMDDWLLRAWDCIKVDDTKGAECYFLNAERRAIMAAAELIQVAAMCRKARKRSEVR